METENDHFEDLNLKEEFSNISMVTPDYRYLLQVFGDRNNILLFDLDRRNLLPNKFDYSLQWQTLQCTSDSKYIFLNTSQTELAQISADTLQIDRVYKFNSTCSACVIDYQSQYLFTVTWDGNFQIFDIETGILVGQLEKQNIGFHRIQLFNDDTKAIISDLSSNGYLVDVKDMKQPKIYHQFNPGVGTLCTFHSNPEDELMIIGNMSKTPIVYNLKELKVEQKLEGHTQRAGWAFFIDFGLKALTSSPTKETIIWNSMDWSKLRVIQGLCTPFFLSHNDFGGIVMNKKLYFWPEDFEQQEE